MRNEHGVAAHLAQLGSTGGRSHRASKVERNSANASEPANGAATTQELQHRFYEGVEVRPEMDRNETFYAIDKARDLLGFAPRHSWRQVLPDHGARNG